MTEQAKSIEAEIASLRAAMEPLNTKATQAMREFQDYIGQSIPLYEEYRRLTDEAKKVKKQADLLWAKANRREDKANRFWNKADALFCQATELELKKG